jgi:hypothetical protein
LAVNLSIPIFKVLYLLQSLLVLSLVPLILLLQGLIASAILIQDGFRFEKKLVEIDVALFKIGVVDG